jgi:hypothetical protein
MPNITFPWIGRVKPWSAALRSVSHKQSHAPALGVLDDLPRGTRVTVVNRNGGWLLVQATFAGKMREGYVSQELIEYVSASTPTPLKKASQTATQLKRRLFFAIYYRVPDNAFQRAASTWERGTRQVFQFDDKVDLFLSIEVRSESEFKAAWNRVFLESKGKFATVIHGQIFHIHRRVKVERETGSSSRETRARMERSCGPKSIALRRSIGTRSRAI